MTDGHIEIVPRQFTDAEWLEAVTAALKADDLSGDLRRGLIKKLLEMRRPMGIFQIQKTA